MQTNFTLAQLADADTRESEKILRTCVHCGFCISTCPTYVLLGDELDSPRGRIYLVKDMLEKGRPATAKVVKHIDRCLSCLACMTACPSGVHYQHLVDHARRHIEETYRRPLPDRLLRGLLALVLPAPRRFRLALRSARALRPFRRLLGGRLRVLFDMLPATTPKASPVDRPQVFAANGARRKRVALLSGCVQRVLAPEINEATVRLLTRHGCEVVVPSEAGCCGALVHHLGREAEAMRAAKANIAAWSGETDGDGLDAVIANASGCGTMVKDYGFILREDQQWAEKAARVSAMTKDVAEFMAGLGLERPARPRGLVVAYQSACSLQHGQKIESEPMALLEAAGFTVRAVPEGHICCGSAGTYNLLQPEIADELRARKVRNIESVGPEIIATGNIGCKVQIGAGTSIPVVHTVELLDWATGGPEPPGIGGVRGKAS